MTISGVTLNDFSLNLLIQRMVALREAVANQEITAQELTLITQLPSSCLQEKTDALIAKTLTLNEPVNKSLVKLYSLLTAKAAPQVTEATTVIEGIKAFEAQYSAYLPLAPLCQSTPDSIAAHLHDFAVLYSVFTRHMDFKKQSGELGHEYSTTCDILAAKTDWVQWKQTRPAYINANASQTSDQGLFEKFINGSLKNNEWLSEKDMHRSLPLLDLAHAGTHIVSLKTEDIALVLHCEREKHQHDTPQNSYVIPLLVNLGEDQYSRVDSRGSHWTRMLISVDPSTPPTKITVDYTDDMFMPESHKKNVKQIIHDALKYHLQTGGYTSNETLKIYTAFPDCDQPVINIKSSEVQSDGYRSGYTALQGLTHNLKEKKIIKPSEIHEELIACKDNKALKELMYQTLLGRQAISERERLLLPEDIAQNALIQMKDNLFAVKPSLVEGQLLAFANTATGKTRVAILDSKGLEALVARNQLARILNETPAIHQIRHSSDNPIIINLEELLASSEIKACNDNELALEVIFTAISNNGKLKTIQIQGTNGLAPDKLHDNIDRIKATDIELTSEDPILHPYLVAVNARNQLVNFLGITIDKEQSTWDQLFEKIFFTPPIKPTGARFEWTTQAMDAGAISFGKALRYMAENEQNFTANHFPYQVFSIGKSIETPATPLPGIDILHALKTHLSSSSPFVPFKEFSLFIEDLSTINQNDLTQEIIGILKLHPSLERLEIRTSSFAHLNEASIQAIIDTVNNDTCSTVISFSSGNQRPDAPLDNLLKKLENIGLEHRRNKQGNFSALQTIKPDHHEQVKLGKIGKAILATESLDSLDTEVQVQQQQQQQQQMQQQIQTSSGNNLLAEEDELEEETFSHYAEDEPLIDRNSIGVLDQYIRNRHPHLDSKACWDMITGSHADLFKYGIKKMTLSAAKILIDHLQDFQFGLHPDNLSGFSLQQDKSGDIVVAYKQFSSVINPNESPLTIRFSKPLTANQWAGNALQFLSSDKAALLYQQIFAKQKKDKPDLQQCINQFFFLKDSNIHLEPEQRLAILDAFIEGISKENSPKIKQQIIQLFGNTLSPAIISALSEVIYQKDPATLAELLHLFQKIKDAKGDAFFLSFKTCFIDTSKNLTELTESASLEAMQKLLTLSSAQSAWWTSLTEQHTSNLNYYSRNDPDSEWTSVTEQPASEATNTPGRRWANLGELTEGFLYFCGQLKERHPGINLTEYCPLSQVADMRVGLDRLLSTILPNALDINEQFYSALSELSLDPLGPFYASRYEGFKLVTPDMKLALGEFSEDPEKDRRYADKDLCFRYDKVNIAKHLRRKETNTHDKKLAVLLRHIAPLNHRATHQQYVNAFTHILNEMMPTRQNLEDNAEESNIANQLARNLLNITAVSCTGKRGKHFTQEQIKALVKWIKSYPDTSPEYVAIYNIMVEWHSSLKNLPIRPTITEIMAISELALKSSYPAQIIVEIGLYTELFKGTEEDFLEIIKLFTQREKSITIDLFHSLFRELENIDPRNYNRKGTPIFSLDNKLKVATWRLLALCQLTDHSEAEWSDKTKKLFTEVQSCLGKHGEQTTANLLELLGHIDIDSSTLPTLDELTAIIRQVSENSKPDYSALEQVVQEKLPAGCSIQIGKVSVATAPSEGNLHMILTKYMHEVMEEMRSNKQQIDNQLGAGFFDNLATPEGPRILLDGLEKIASFENFIGGIVKAKIMAVMNKIYDSVMNDGINRVGIKDDNIQKRLSKIVTHKMNHQIRNESDFTRYATRYAREMDSLSQLLSNLQQIQKKWPSQFDAILNCLDSNAYLNTYPLPLLAKIMSSLASQSDNSKAFPEEILRQLLSVSSLDKKTEDALNSLLDTVFDTEQSTVYTIKERELITKLAVKYCQTNPDGANRFTENIMGLHSTTDAFFEAKLNILLTSESLDHGLKEIQSAIEQIKAFNHPPLSNNLFSFFTAERANAFIPFMKEITGADQNKQSMLINIILKAAQNESASDILTDIITPLAKLDIEKLAQLEHIYANPKYPSLSALKEIITLENINLSQLEEEYDRDPGGKRKDKAYLLEQFDTSKLTHYIDNLRDMNYDRPLLLSQRQELQQWFLYINTIGKDRPIQTTPWAPEQSALKPIKDMSHSEIQALMNHYRRLCVDPHTAADQKTRAQLDTIALLREAMYRGNGNFPRPTQILYLLTAMQNKGDYVAQIQTGQGKSLIAALASVMSYLEGKNGDVFSSTPGLANDGLEENRDFFAYLGVPVKLIHAKSAMEDYQEGAVHYSSMNDLALYLQKMELFGKVFPEDRTMILDEIDFSTLDDNTRYRFAIPLDPITDPYKSSYTWVYESLITFVDMQKVPQKDEAYLEQAKIWLRQSAKSREEKLQIKKLEEQPDVYEDRLSKWLIAAGNTQQLMNEEINEEHAQEQQSKFRRTRLEHPDLGVVTKACIMKGRHPQIEAEFCHGIQQFLHVRLRQKYRSQIDDGSMPDFLVEPEKTYVTSLNSKILVDSYSRKMGMTATVGSSEEIKEQYAKYGLRFIEIPPFSESRRIDLKPLLTNSRWVGNPAGEKADHINQIVKYILRHTKSQADGQCSPLLIHCADKVEGEKIYQALHKAMNHYSDIQRFYGSEKPTPEQRNQEEQQIKEQAGKNGMITISTVLDRGTDIKPRHPDGLHSILTYVDTGPCSSEDLERSKRQKLGRSGRAGQVGHTRLIVRRSEFKDVYTKKQMQSIEETNEALDTAIADLNKLRNQKRVIERAQRESFDDVKHMIYQQFFPFIDAINTVEKNIPKKAIRDTLLREWNLLLGQIDNQWEELQHDPALHNQPEEQLKKIATFACDAWGKLAQSNGALRNQLNKWAEHQQIALTLPSDNLLDADHIIKQVNFKHPVLTQHYVKSMQRHAKLDPLVSGDAVYADLMSKEQNPSNKLQQALAQAKTDEIDRYITRQAEQLSTPALMKRLAGRFDPAGTTGNAAKAEQIMGALLYLRYHAYRDGNPLAHAKYTNECRQFATKMVWGNASDLMLAVSRAQQTHATRLTTHRGNHEEKKGTYLSLIMNEARKILPEQTAAWKKDSFNQWWDQGAKGPIQEALLSYKDHWWARSWVSNDRKERVEQLLSALATPNQSAVDILQHISNTRATLIEDDLNHKRSMKSGISGRLNQLLNQVEQTIHASMTADELDRNVNREFIEIKTVLSGFQKKLDHKGIAKVIASIETEPSVKRKYLAVSELFTHVLQMNRDDKRFQSEDWQALHAYCSQKQTDMVFYFAQCKENCALNTQRSVTVFQALSKTAAITLDAALHRSPPAQMNLPPEKFDYLGHKIDFRMNRDVSEHSKKNPLFRSINQESAYTQLLRTLEKYIVEHSSGNPLVKFSAIAVEQSELHADSTGFKLIISMTLDGVAAELPIHIDMKNGAITYDNTSLEILDAPPANEPDLAASSLSAQCEKNERDWQKLREDGKKITSNARQYKERLAEIKETPVKERSEEDSSKHETGLK